MLLNALKYWTSGPRSVVLIIGLLFAALYLMSAATQNSAEFGKIYSLLLSVNILAILLLIGLILRNLYTLIIGYRQRATGSRLTVRLVVMFIILSVAPVTAVYYFALGFLNRGIDSWFDVRIDDALHDALELGRISLDNRLRELLRQTRLHSNELQSLPETRLPIALNEIRQRSEALEITLLTLSGKVIYSSSSNPTELVPSLPNTAILTQLRQGMDYTALEPVKESGLHIRIAMLVPGPDKTGESRALHVIYPIDERINRLADSVQDAFGQYRELAYLRQPLKYSFTLTLSLVLLLSLLSAVWAAFFSARRLVAPIRDLAEGTRAVAAGDYDKRLPLPGRDELGFLVRSFNEMTRKIALARDEASRSQAQVEEQRTYLETLLGSLSSGVLSLDSNGMVLTANHAARQILNIELVQENRYTLHDLVTRYPLLEPFIQAIEPHLEQRVPSWHAEVVLFGANGRQVLMCRGSTLPGYGDVHAGHVVIFDDVTTLIQAQRDAAWGEVARRLAHEIKNPLTPIQLSAERLRRKYLPSMPEADAEVLDRATHTIVQQVETMKEMVKAFSDYARPPKVQFENVRITHLITEVVDLYRGIRNVHFNLELADETPVIEADVGRLRQLLHNLFKNAMEARNEEETVEITVSCRCDTGNECHYIEVIVRDNGPGIPDNLLGQLFEPYVTTKPKGTGLGLAIVKKIVEEHSGMLRAENLPEGGAAIVLRLPVHTHPNGEMAHNGNSSNHLIERNP